MQNKSVFYPKAVIKFISDVFVELHQTEDYEQAARNRNKFSIPWKDGNDEEKENEKKSLSLVSNYSKIVARWMSRREL